MFLTMGIFGNFEGWWGEFLTFKTGIPNGPGGIMATGFLLDITIMCLLTEWSVDVDMPTKIV